MHVIFKIASIAMLLVFLAHQVDNPNLVELLTLIQVLFIIISLICCSGKSYIFDEACGSYSDESTFAYSIVDALGTLSLVYFVDGLVRRTMLKETVLFKEYALFLFLLWSNRTIILTGLTRG